MSHLPGSKQTKKQTNKQANKQTNERTRPQVPSPDAVFDYMIADVMCAVVVELIATPAQTAAPGAGLVQYLVGWAACVPFSFISDDGAHAEVSEAGSDDAVW
jgi:hypothetical protein